MAPLPLRTIAALALVSAAAAHAQSLGETPPITRVMDAAQFGVPRDTKFIFCDGPDCPERTTKTFTVPKPAPVVAAPPPAVLPMPQSVQPPAELSRAKVPPPKKKVVRKKPAAKLDCGPVAKS